MDEQEIIREQRALTHGRKLLDEFRHHMRSHTFVDPDDLANSSRDLISDAICPREQELDFQLAEIESVKELEHERRESQYIYEGLKTT